MKDRTGRSTRKDLLLKTIPAHLGGSGTIPGGAHEKIITKSSTSELVKEQHMERVDPLCSFFTKFFLL